MYKNATDEDRAGLRDAMCPSSAGDSGDSSGDGSYFSPGVASVKACEQGKAGRGCSQGPLYLLVFNNTLFFEKDAEISMCLHICTPYASSTFFWDKKLLRAKWKPFSNLWNVIWLLLWQLKRTLWPGRKVSSAEDVSTGGDFYHYAGWLWCQVMFMLTFHPFEDNFPIDKYFWKGFKPPTRSN